MSEEFIKYASEQYVDDKTETIQENVDNLSKTIPTKTSQLSNDSGFITKVVGDLTNYYLKSETYTRTEIGNLISTIPKFAISVVSGLPTSNISETTVYLVRNGSNSGNLYTEYIYSNGAWEILGSQEVDLTGYTKQEEVSEMITTEFEIQLENFYDKGEIDVMLDDVRNEVDMKLDEFYDQSEIDLKLEGSQNEVDEKIEAAKEELRDETPTKLPNPNALTFTGAASGSYDGSSAKTVNIPEVPSALPNPNALTFTGGATESYDGSSAKTVNIPSKTSELTNDSEFITKTVSDLENYYKKTETFSQTETTERLEAVYNAIPRVTSKLTNDSGFITKTVGDLTNYYLKSETYTRTEIGNLISAIPKFAIMVVNTLPTSGISETTVYLVKTGSESQNIYEEYIYTGGAWELLGTQKVDLSDYPTHREVSDMIATEFEIQLGEYITEGDVEMLFGDYYKRIDIDNMLETTKEELRTEIPLNTSDLTNDSGFITKAVSDLTNYYLKNETYSREEVGNLISAIPKFTIQVVSVLPTSNISVTTVYLMKSGSESGNLYEEYIYANGAWELLGAQKIDLSNYPNRIEVSEMIDEAKTEIQGDFPASLPNPKVLYFNGAVSDSYDGSATKTINIPTVPNSLKNPYALDFTGAVTGSYDGSTAKTVHIPTVPTSLKNPYALKFTGGATATYDGSAETSVKIPTTLKNPNALIINGTAYDGSKVVSMTISEEVGTSGYLEIYDTRGPYTETKTYTQDDLNFGDIDLGIELVPGNLYTVKWNGEEYSCIASNDQDANEEDTLFVLGNESSVTGDGNHEPFLIYQGVSWGEPFCFIIDHTNSETVDVAICEGGITRIHEIQPGPAVELPFMNSGDQLVSMSTMSSLGFTDEDIEPGSIYSVYVGGAKFRLLCTYKENPSANEFAYNYNDIYQGIPAALAHGKGVNAGFLLSVPGTEDQEGTYSVRICKEVYEPIPARYLLQVNDSKEETAIILKSSTEGSNKKFRITIDDSGTLIREEITE